MKTNIIQFPHPERPVIPDIASRHLEDAAFFWSQRDAIIGQRRTLWNNVQRLDKKILAHIRGIQATGKTGWQLALTGFEREEAEGEMFAAINWWMVGGAVGLGLATIAATICPFDEPFGEAALGSATAATWASAFAL